MNTFIQVQHRFNALIGEDPTLPASTAGKSHINAAVGDIISTYPFSWNRANANLTLVNGQANLPADFMYQWHIEDARIVGVNTNDDIIFYEIPLLDKDRYPDVNGVNAYGLSNNGAYWLSYDSVNQVYVFNTKTSTGTINITYHFDPADMVNDNDICIVTDSEATAYLAAAKNWISDERNQALKQDFEQEAQNRTQLMYAADGAMGPVYRETSKVGLNWPLRGF